MGAASAGLAAAGAFLGASQAIAAGIGFLADIGYGFLTAPAAIPSGGEQGFGNGVNSLINPGGNCPNTDSSPQASHVN